MLRSANDELGSQLRRFWEVEQLPPTSMLTQAELACEEIFRDTYGRTEDGRYMVRLPLRADPRLELGDSERIARAALLRLERRLATQPELRAAYIHFMDEYERLGHMTPAQSVPGEAQFCIPHHAVVKTSDRPLKIRVVFNASQPSASGRSLNDLLHVGPRLQSPSDPILAYRLNTVTYRTASAPYLALRVLRQLAQDEQNAWPRAAELIRANTYVDDILAGADSEADAQALQRELINLLRAGGFSLRKWASNSAVVLESVCEEDREPLIQIRDRDAVGAPILGVHWLPLPDSLCYAVNQEESSPLTKRGILSTTARLFDPMGWISPVIVRGKILLQELWLAGVDWNQPLSPTMVERWQLLRGELADLHAIRIPRWVGWSPNIEAELHGFSDASERAYAAAIYLVTRPRDGPAAASLLFPKTRVSPVCCWTDSTVALAWIRGHPSRWSSFVANRVGAIHEMIPGARWGHVSTVDNPADAATSGLSPAALRSHDIWWGGPTWLLLPEDRWPKREPPLMTAPEERRVVHAATVALPEWDGLIRASSYRRALHVMAYVLRVVTRSAGSAVGLTASELRRAEIRLIRLSQEGFFDHERRCAQSGLRLPRDSSLRTLCPVLDQEGLLRVGGRLASAQLPVDERCPIVLPRQSHFTTLLVRDIHERTLHGGTQLTLATLRERFWVPAGRAFVRGLLHRCVVCTRHQARPMQPMMAPLPRDRVVPTAPFNVAGVDYAGPVSLTASRGRDRRAFK
ncbi:uncharacterized protein LOC116853726, partial [Odontomachus brunneus]|uniref:uncharacterized protein LOC116853726 n=1 Tax=Odontomachus brunneus TaxID=486640 RepID=UPI0013F19652